MGVRLIEGRDSYTTFYCSTTMWAFGPVLTSREEAEAFLAFLGRDPRRMTDGALEKALGDFHQAQDETHNQEVDDRNAVDRSDA